LDSWEVGQLTVVIPNVMLLAPIIGELLAAEG
jgi:hypothetical protein